MEASAEWRGTLTRNSLPQVLRTIFRETRTGTLVLTKADETHRFYFEGGELRTATSSNQGRRIGTFLRRHGAISEEALNEAIDPSAESGKRVRLGKLLVDRGLISRDKLDFEMRRLVEEIVFSTFAWDGAEFVFRDSKGKLDPEVVLNLSTAAVIVEGIRRLPGREEFVDRLGDLNRSVAVVEDPASQYQFLALTPQEAYLLSACDGTTAMRDLLKLTTSRTEAAKVLFALIECGLVEPIEPNSRRASSQRRGTPLEGLNVKVVTVEEPKPKPPKKTEVEDDHRTLIRETYRRLGSASAYEILGIEDSALPAEVESAFQLRSRLFHPDLKFRDDLSDLAKELRVLYTSVQRAHAEILRSPEAGRRPLPVAEVTAVSKPLEIAEDEDPSAGSGARVEIARKNYLEARRLLELGDYFGAIKCLQECIRFSPDNAEYHFRLAGAMAKNPHWKDRAIHHYQEAMSRDPLRKDVLFELAEFLLTFGRRSEAQILAKRLIERHPDESRFRDLLARSEAPASAPAARERTGVRESEAKDVMAGRTLFSWLFKKK